MLSILCLMLPLAACGPVSDKTHYAHRGFDVNATHPLLNLKLTNEPYSKSSFGGAFLFAIGGASGSSSSGIKPKIGLAINAGRGQVVVLKFDANKTDYQLDKNATTPYLRLWEYGQSFDTAESLSQNLDNNTSRLMIYLTPKDFNADVAVIKYVGALGG